MNPLVFFSHQWHKKLSNTLVALILLHCYLLSSRCASAQVVKHLFQGTARWRSLRVLRRDDTDEITLCDLTGTGIQDTAIATLAYQLCQQHKAGTIFTS